LKEDNQMWNFVSPRIVFGEGALDALNDVQGKRALIVTDAQLVRAGLVEKVKARLAKSGIDVRIFDSVEPEPSVQTVLKGAQIAEEFAPDWFVGVGGGSPMDAAKAIWVLYERPDIDPAAISPLIRLGLRQKARLITIPTTSGTGSEATWVIVLTDIEGQRKMGLGNRENVADIAIVDPVMAAGMPPRLTADTGLDALTHAIEGYTCTWRSDITDGLCLNAARLVFAYLLRAVEDGSDMEAREKMHNAATCAGLGFGNAMASVAHAMGHSLGAMFHVPHGRAVALFLPYTIEFISHEAPDGFAELAALLGLSDEGGVKGARTLAWHVRELARKVGNPISIADEGVKRRDFEKHLEKMMDNAFNDTQMITPCRSPSYDELRELFLHAYEGKTVEF
jgi:alcohol dehydrogenase class IV